jgi:hypothetical protein
MNTKNHHFSDLSGRLRTEGTNCGLYPLIHTRLVYNLKQYVGLGKDVGLGKVTFD